MRVLKMAGIGLAVSLAATAVADELSDELQKCAQLKNPEVRLACYDALAELIAAQPLEESASGEAAIRTAPAPSTEPRPAAKPAQEEDSGQSLASRVFGLLPGGDDVNKIESRVVGEVDGLGQGKRFELENGQVWRQVDRTERNYRATNPRVEIKEGFMNSYRMRFEGLNARIRVRRVK